jgi:hypothetical protein
MLHVVVVVVTKDQPRGLLQVTESNRYAGKLRGKSSTTVVNKGSWQSDIMVTRQHVQVMEWQLVEVVQKKGRQSSTTLQQEMTPRNAIYRRRVAPDTRMKQERKI